MPPGPFPSTRISVPFQVKDLLTPKEVAGRLSIATNTLWRMVKRGQFPQPIRFNRRLVRWKAHDVVQYLDNLRNIDPALAKAGGVPVS